MGKRDASAGGWWLRKLSMIDEQKALERTVTGTVAKLVTSSSFYKATTAAARAITRDPGIVGD